MTDPYYFMQPQLPVTTPMKIDRAGAKYVMHFWVLPEPSSRRVRPFFVGVRSTLSFDRDAAIISEVKDFLRQADIPVQVKLTKLDEPTERKIQLLAPPVLIDDKLSFAPLLNDLAPTREYADADNDLLIKNKILDQKRDANIDYRYFQFAELRNPEPGYYRLEVQVLKDNPNAPKIPTDLIVSNHYKGK